MEVCFILVHKWNITTPRLSVTPWNILGVCVCRCVCGSMCVRVCVQTTYMSQRPLHAVLSADVVFVCVCIPAYACVFSYKVSNMYILI